MKQGNKTKNPGGLSPLALLVWILPRTQTSSSAFSNVKSFTRAKTLSELQKKTTHLKTVFHFKLQMHFLSLLLIKIDKKIQNISFCINGITDLLKTHKIPFPFLVTCTWCSSFKLFIFDLHSRIKLHFTNSKTHCSSWMTEPSMTKLVLIGLHCTTCTY